MSVYRMATDTHGERITEQVSRINWVIRERIFAGVLRLSTIGLLTEAGLLDVVVQHSDFIAILDVSNVVMSLETGVILLLLFDMEPSRQLETANLFIPATAIPVVKAVSTTQSRGPGLASVAPVRVIEDGISGSPLACESPIRSDDGGRSDE